MARLFCLLGMWFLLPVGWIVAEQAGSWSNWNAPLEFAGSGAGMGIQGSGNVEEIPVSDGLGPLAFLGVLLLMCAVFLILVGIGIVLGMFLVAGLMGLIAVGVVTSSTLVGLATKRPKAGVRALLLQTGALTGGALGTGVAILLYYFGDLLTTEWSPPPVVFAAATGALAGVLAGLLLAIGFHLLGERIYRVAAEAIERRRAEVRS